MAGSRKKTLGDSGSLNFHFLERVEPLLAELGARAEGYALTDPNTSLMKTRQLGELLAQLVAAEFGIDPTEGRKDQSSLIQELFHARVLPSEIKDQLHEIRKAGNRANHDVGAASSTPGEAITILRFARSVAVWFYRSFRDPNVHLGKFMPPRPLADTSAADRAELERLSILQTEAQQELARLRDESLTEAQLREIAEQEREQAYADLEAALELAEEETERTEARIAEYEVALVEAARVELSDDDREMRVEVSQQVVAEEFTEDETRELIDLQLRQAGWTVDSVNLRHARGTRPQKHKNMAIAEWPTKSGPADYVLFVGLRPVAVVEAKRSAIDVAGAIEQAKRYSRSVELSDDMDPAGGPWGEYEIPFLFSSNGRDYIKQIKTKSGVWFLDARRSTNHPRPLPSWHSPDDIKQMLIADEEDAEDRLLAESPDYLPLRDYQQAAVRAVEDAVARGDREMLVAMATGTGKTRTCIGICYRFLKAKRFRRVLFLVDRTSLGEQASDSLNDLRIENNQTFSDIYDVKELGDLTPDIDTKFHIATIQGMVHRLLDPTHEDDVPSVGQYDLIVVDECHRGYNLDQELSENELRFRDEADFISKYSRVLEYFDAVKIGLTATPALHTLELFGGESQTPVYQYSYRQAVLDGFLIDHEPPIQIRTKLSTDGIKWEAEEEVQVYDTATGQVELFTTPDEIELEIESFNKRVVNENFNRVVCEALAERIDPTLPGKTLVYCVTDSHADMVVDELKNVFTERYGSIPDDAVRKITGKSDKPLEQIRRYKNEALPSVAVTVDLLTTGIDVPEITNLVFLRRVRSRILYEQMLGRATRLSEDLFGPGMDKDAFNIFDCVDLYSALQSYTDMKPVVTKPNITFGQLLDELASTTNVNDRRVIQEQLVAKLQRKKRSIRGSRATQFEEKNGFTPESLVQQIATANPDEIVEWFADKSALVEFLDTVTSSGGAKLLVSEHDDEVTLIESGFGAGNKRPADFLEEFRDYVLDNQDRVEALKLCAQKPSALTRESLRELQLELDAHGFSKMQLRVAWRETTNVDVAATIIGYVRNVMLDAPLVPFEDRVNAALTEILASRQWSKPQRMWLERIGSQIRENVLIDRDSFDQGAFQDSGGYNRLNKVFDGELDQLLAEVTEQIWALAA